MTTKATLQHQSCWCPALSQPPLCPGTAWCTPSSTGNAVSVPSPPPAGTEPSRAFVSSVLSTSSYLTIALNSRRHCRPDSGMRKLWQGSGTCSKVPASKWGRNQAVRLQGQIRWPLKSQRKYRCPRNPGGFSCRDIYGRVVHNRGNKKRTKYLLNSQQAKGL